MPRPAILTITLNPAVDLFTSVAAVRPGDKLRCDAPDSDPGGGGTNVARAITLLGGEALAFVSIAGHAGARFIDLLVREGVRALVHDISGETRQSLSVIDRSDGQEYRFVMPGPAWGAEQAQGALDILETALPARGLVVLSGSQPPGVPAHFPTQLAALCEARGARLLLDTSGPPLHALLRGGAARSHVLRLDRAEARALSGRDLDGIAEVAAFAGELVAQGVADCAIIGRGAQGSVMAGHDGAWHGESPAVPARSAVGAGDSFMGAFALALSRGEDRPQALCHGVAAASAAVMNDTGTLFRPEDARRLAESCTLRRLG